MTSPADKEPTTPTHETSSAEFASRTSAPADLRNASVRGAATTIVGQVVKFALRFGSTAILARILTPEDYGLIAMTAAITGFVGVFKDAGLGSATIQRAEITQEQISTLYWINIALGTAIALFLAAVSPLVAAFFGDSRLTLITCALAGSFILSGATVQHTAILRRQMRFGMLARLEITSMLAGVIIAVVMAVGGFRYWALVGMTLGSALTNAIQVHFVADWRPGRPSRSSGVGSMIRFGGDVLAFNVLNYFSRQGDNLLIGWWWGSATLGLYEKAYSLLLLPIAQINGPLAAVAMPALSRSVGDPPKFARIFLGTLELVASASIPIVFAIAVFANEVVWLWLGPVWAESAILFRLLAFGALLGALSNPIGWMMMAFGDSARLRRLGVWNSSVLIISFAIGLPYGAQGVAFSFSTFGSLMFLPAWWYALKGKPMRLGRVMATFVPPLVSCAPASLGALALLHFGRSFASDIVTTLVAAIYFGSVYAGLLLFVFKKRAFYVGLLKDLRASKSPETPGTVQAESGETPK